MLDIKSYNNPLSVQSLILKKIEDGFNGEKTIVDPNNAYCTLIEAFSEIIADSILAIENKFYSIYPKRALNSYDLYNHISDFEYIGIFSLPASTNIELILHKDYLIENAIQYSYGNNINTNYKLVEIPVNSIFSIGNYNFSLYYPIHIQINDITNSISVIYDTTKDNPLHSLKNTNITKREYNFNGLNLLSISFPVYQFERTVIEEIIQPEFGFRKQYKYEDKFYAIRVYNFINNQYEEMKYTMSNISYDPLIPTAALKVYPETNILEVSIPQIYFTNNQIGTKIKLEIYTTNGELNVSIDNINIENIMANFNLSEKNADITYSKILKNIPYMQILPLDTAIVGGSDGYSFEELKNRIIYGSTKDKVPITNKDIDFFFRENGFQLEKKIDNLTDRIYYAHKKIEYDNEELLVINTLTKLNKEIVENTDDILNEYSSILKYENSITILPNTIYKYEPEINQSIILNDEEAKYIEPNGDNVNIDKINNGVYIKSPYYISVCTKDAYPFVIAYDLYSCSTSNINFIAENKTMSIQADIVDSSIIHYLVKQPDGSYKKSKGGFKLYIEVLKSSDLANIPDYEDENSQDITPNFIVHLSMVSTNGYKIGMDGYLETDLSSSSSFVYSFDMESNFIFDNDTISLNNMKSTAEDDYYIVNLLSKAVVSFHIKKSLITSPQVSDDFEISNYLINSAKDFEITYNPNDYYGISCQSIDIEFGKKLNDKIYNNLTVTYSPQEVEIWDHDVIDYYDKDIYERDANGKLVYTESNGNLVLNKLHSIGDPKLDAHGNPIYLHKAGEIKLDAYGNYIIKNPRAIEYTFEFFAFDVRYFHENNDFDLIACDILNNYYSSLTNLQENILENTKCYFKPIDRIGSHEFYTSNTETIKLPLELLFKITCYVSTKTYNDTSLHIVIINKIKDTIKEYLSNTLISFVDIANKIKENLGDLIVNIDINGIDGYSLLQTLINTSTSKIPSIKKKLIKLDNNVLKFDDIIDITFKKID